MNQAAFQLADRKELQRTIKARDFIERREREWVSGTEQKKQIGSCKVTSFRDSKGLSNRLGFPGVSVEKNPPANSGDAGSIPGSGRSPGGGNGNPLQYSCLDNSMARGTQRATVHGVAKSSWSTNIYSKQGLFLLGHNALYDVSKLCFKSGVF